MAGPSIVAPEMSRRSGNAGLNARHERQPPLSPANEVMRGEGRLYQCSETGAPRKISSILARVARVASSGKASMGKNRTSAISRSGRCAGLQWNSSTT